MSSVLLGIAMPLFGLMQINSHLFEAVPKALKIGWLAVILLTTLTTLETGVGLSLLVGPLAASMGIELITMRTATIAVSISVFVGICFAYQHESERITAKLFNAEHSQMCAECKRQTVLHATHT